MILPAPPTVGELFPLSEYASFQGDPLQVKYICVKRGEEEKLLRKEYIVLEKKFRDTRKFFWNLAWKGVKWSIVKVFYYCFYL